MSRRRGELLRLNVDNIPAYLSTIGQGVPFSIRQIKKIEEVSKYGNNNFIFRLVIRPRSRFYYLKQAQAFNRRSLQQGKPIAVEPSRMAGEVSLLRHLKKLWGPGIVPEVFFYDRSRAIMLMSDVGSGGRLLVEEFERGYVHPELGRILGRLLGKLHATTYGRPRRVDSNRAWQARITKWLFGVHFAAGVNRNFPKSRVQQFYRSVARSPRATIWGDPVHRNIFVRPRGHVGLVDFDHTVTYDPMIDVGMLLSHWAWMRLLGKPRISRDCDKFLKSFNRAYWQTWSKQHRLNAAERLTMQRRMLRWVGLYLLSRVDGKSGSYFKAQPAWEKRIRSLGIELFSGDLKNVQTAKFVNVLA